MGLQPVAEALELDELLAVLAGVAVGVVADEHLREVRVEALDVLAEVIAVLEVEHVLPGALGGHRQLQALARGPPRGRWSRTARRRARPSTDGVGAGADGLQHALEDQVLGVGDDRRLLGVGLAFDPEELLLEGAAVVEREDVELLVVAGFMPLSIPKARRRGVGRPIEWIGRCPPRRRSVRRLQAVRVGGEPVHHRVPLLRAPPAPPRAEAAA